MKQKLRSCIKAREWSIPGTCPMTLIKLIPKWFYNAVLLLCLEVGRDLGLANLVGAYVAFRLLRILENLDIFDIQYWAAGILSRTNSLFVLEGGCDQVDALDAMHIYLLRSWQRP